MSQLGKVYLVGSGPGDPDLLTVKALRLIRSADVVVYDRLVSAEILALIPEKTKRWSVGKAAGRHCVPQDQINPLLYDLAKRYPAIVRLKGGDPFIFGRGSEEAEFLGERRVAFEVVPGITAAAACTAYSGIPLTHRGMSRIIHIATGHFRDDEPLDLDWSALTGPESTLVVYMGLSNIERITDGLMRAGMPGETPAAAIQNGTTPDHYCLTSRVDRLASEVREAGMAAPVLLVFGEVVRLADVMGGWFLPAAPMPARVGEM
ncbi:MAG: uroporphyrinogen-III C-methyltransferase [Gammaproteobacteria bacterium]|nr:uroporphyrinogen-III C-methyltransferase [Gammaproteobacteria bacterium]MBU1655890.1 uroporphyrinogen-III C-methyltransferase [Gammaproteobacteria bacterium]MBU1961013.1 uroporphyrinogen-III C-methyltransferase [Gammaproteobacteria bacterium]